MVRRRHGCDAMHHTASFCFACEDRSSVTSRKIYGSSELESYVSPCCVSFPQQGELECFPKWRLCKKLHHNGLMYGCGV